MKNRLILLLSLLAVSTALFAAPARKGLVPRTQPDGTTIMVRLHGDEFGHWLTDASGNLLAKDSDGFLRPVADGGIAIRQNGERASARRAAAIIPRKSMLRQCLAYFADKLGIPERNGRAIGPMIKTHSHFIGA